MADEEIDEEKVKEADRRIKNAIIAGSSEPVLCDICNSRGPMGLYRPGDIGENEWPLTFCDGCAEDYGLRCNKEECKHRNEDGNILNGKCPDAESIFDEGSEEVLKHLGVTFH